MSLHSYAAGVMKMFSENGWIGPQGTFLIVFPEIIAHVIVQYGPKNQATQFMRQHYRKQALKAGDGEGIVSLLRLINDLLSIFNFYFSLCLCLHGD